MTKNQFLRIVGVTCMSSLVTISATASPVVTDDPNVEEHEHEVALHPSSRRASSLDINRLASLDWP